MAVVLGTNAGFVTVAPTVDPDGMALAVDNLALCHKHVCPAGVTIITEIGWYNSVVVAENNLDLGLYSHDVGGDTADVLLESSVDNVPQGLGWNVITGLNWSVVPGTIYWLAIQQDIHDGTSGIDSTLGSGRNGINVGATSLPTPFNSSADVARVLAIYAKVEAGAGGVELDIADSLTIVEAVTFYGPTLDVDISDSIAITESLTISKSADHNPDISDSIGIVEALLIVLDTPRGVLWRDRPIILTVNIADAITITESLSPAGHGDKSISDSITITEAITVLLTTLFVDVVDSIAITESVTPSKGLTSAGYFDSITINEKLTIAIVVGSGRNPLPVQRQQVR